MALVEDRVLIELHRAAVLAGRPGIAVPSLDLDAADESTGSHSRSREAVRRLERAGRVVSVRKDLLVLPEVTGRITVGLADLVDAVAPQPYLITGGAALEHHDLTDQHFYSFAVLTPSRVTPIQYRTERAVFLPTEPKYIWGGKDRPHFATPDRVLLDVLNSPRYNVPFSVAVSALNLAICREQKFLRRLLASARRFQSDAVARRVGLLVEELAGPELAAPFRELIGGSRTPVLLRRGGQTEGPVNSAWRVIVNASIELEAAGSK